MNAKENTTPPGEVVPHQVKVLRIWLEEFIATPGICPPLAILLKRYRESDGLVDWARLSAENALQIDTLYAQRADDADLSQNAADIYLSFMEKILRGEKIYSLILLLPKFKSNEDYDSFVEDVKRKVMANILFTAELKAAAVLLMRKVVSLRNGNSEDIDYMVGLSETNPGLFGQRIVEGILGMVYFYGQELSAGDMDGLDTERGPRERQKYLSRAPYYLIQVVNSLLTEELAGNLDSSKLFVQNTQRAKKLTAKQLNARMHELKNSK